MKRAMIFTAKMNLKQNNRLMDVLSQLTGEQLREAKPLLRGGSLMGAVAGLIGTCQFSQGSMHLESMKFHELSAPYIEDRGPDAGFVSFEDLPSYGDASFEELRTILHCLSEGYVKGFEGCDNDELCDESGGLAAFDFLTKGLMGAMYARGQILYVLAEMGYKNIDLMEGPLVD